MTQQIPPLLHRLRFTYQRGPETRYVSLLDMQLVWERTFRRAGLPLAYSQGFSPHPRMQMAAALPLGFLSQCEVIDAWLKGSEGQPFDPQAARAQAQASAPPGVKIICAEEVPLNLPALQTLVSAAEYLVAPLDPLDEQDLRSRVETLLAAPSLPRERRKKPYDLRPLVETLEMRGSRLFMRLTARVAATGRPEEVLDALGYDPTDWRVERINLILT